MKINHIAMYVFDIEKSREFYEKYFGAVSNSKYHNIKTGLKTYFLSFDGEVRLEIMSRPECEKSYRSEFKGRYTHLAFSVGSRENVDNLTSSLKTDSFAVASEPRITGDGYYESVVIDYDGNMIEITV